MPRKVTRRSRSAAAPSSPSSIPLAYTGAFRPRPFRIQSSADGMSTTVTGHDYIGTIVGTATTDHIVKQVQLSPVSWPARLRLLAQGWERFKFKQVKIHYTSTVAATTAGSLVFAYDLDPRDIETTGDVDLLPRLLANQSAMMYRVAAPFTFTAKMDLTVPYCYCTTTPADSETRTDFQGQIWIVLTGGAASTTYGHISLEYVIEFRNPQLDTTLGVPTREQKSVVNTATAKKSIGENLAAAISNGSPAGVFNTIPDLASLANTIADFRRTGALAHSLERLASLEAAISAVSAKYGIKLPPKTFGSYRFNLSDYVWGLSAGPAPQSATFSRALQNWKILFWRPSNLTAAFLSNAPDFVHTNNLTELNMPTSVGAVVWDPDTYMYRYPCSGTIAMEFAVWNDFDDPVYLIPVSYLTTPAGDSDEVTLPGVALDELVYYDIDLMETPPAWAWYLSEVDTWAPLAPWPTPARRAPLVTRRCSAETAAVVSGPVLETAIPTASSAVVKEIVVPQLDPVIPGHLAFRDRRKASQCG